MGHQNSGRSGARGAQTAVAFESAVVVALVVLFAMACWYTTRPATIPDSFALVQVTSGSTLWELASRYTEDGDSVARTVEIIRHENHLGDSSIVPGTTLRVPVNAHVDAVAMR